MELVRKGAGGAGVAWKGESSLSKNWKKFSATEVAGGKAIVLGETGEVGLGHGEPYKTG